MNKSTSVRPQCTAPGCERLARSRTSAYCDTHYQRIQRTGTLDTGRRSPLEPPPECTFEGCSSPAYANGSCKLHYQEVYRLQHPVKPTPTSTTNSIPCPECSGDKSEVRDSRPDGEGHIRRRRECSACSCRFTTYELLDEEINDLKERVASKTKVRRNAKIVAEWIMKHMAGEEME